MTGSGGGDTRCAFFAGFEKLSVCWPLGSLRFASIFAAASTCVEIKFRAPHAIDATCFP